MISIIVAVSQNGVIGKDNKLLWNIKEDLQRFKEITSGHTIIMGRKTFESLLKILPNRHHIIITRNKNYKIDNENVEILNDIKDIIGKYQNTNEEVFIIGGEEIYKQFLPYTDKLYLTIVFENFKGDSYFYMDNNWKTEYVSKIKQTQDNLKYIFMNLKRNN